MTEKQDRNPDGTFAHGNPGGPGRPRRQVETDYLLTLSDAITQDDWREIVVRAVVDAKTGDAKAREWIAHYVTGTATPTLFELARREAVGVVFDDDLKAADASEVFSFTESLQSRAINAARGRQRAEQEEAEREARRLAREARKAAKLAQAAAEAALDGRIATD